MAKRDLSAAYNNTPMEDVTKKSLGLAFIDEEEPKDKEPKSKPVIEEAPIAKPKEKKVPKKQLQNLKQHLKKLSPVTE